MPIYRSGSSKSSSRSAPRVDSAKDDGSAAEKSSQTKDVDKQPLDTGTVKKFLLKNPKFLDSYVKATVDLSRLRDWLENKDRTLTSSGSSPRDCPNASLLCHFQQGQDAGRYLSPPCCTCTQLPIGSKARRPYIIYALDMNDSQGNCQHEFTVPRVMTNAEMGAFGRRYGLDLHRRMNMY